MRTHACVPKCILVFSLGAALFTISNLAIAAVGALPGVHSTTRSGAATYDIALDLPRDRLTPEIGISYNHARGNSLLGVGMALSGFSTIQRCARTTAQDVLGSPVTGETAADGYCLDGNRLRLATGTYGAAGSTYRTELETFSRVTPQVGANYIESWTVETADGLIHEYGVTTDSRVMSVGFTPTPRIWAKNRTRDRVGNYIDYSYTLDPSGSYRVNEVRYSGNSMQSVAPSTRVVFVYEAATRPDPLYQYRQADGTEGSGLIVEFKRLDRIDIIHNDTSHVVRTYDLSYDPAGGAGSRSRLTSVQECSAGDCLPATTFQWVNGTQGWFAETSAGATFPAPSSTIVMDFDNDGQEDILYPSSATSGAGTWMVLRGSNSGYLAPFNTTAPNWNHANAQVIEWDGDGAADLLVPCSNGTTWCVFYQRTGVAPNLTFVSTPLNTNLAIAQPGTTAANEWLAVDVNGDGRSDLVRMNKAPAGTAHGLALRLRDGSGFLPEVVVGTFSEVWLRFVDSFASLIAAKKSSTYRRMDFDGDGREDFYAYAEADLDGFPDRFALIFRSYDPVGTPNYVELVQALVLSREGVHTPIWAGDFNGDGLTDLAYPLSSTPFVLPWRIYYGDGYGVTPAVHDGPNLTLEQVQFAMVADLDADGMSDLLVKTPSSANLMYARSFGSTFGPLVDTGLNAASTAGSMIVTDLTGDGLQDLARVDSANALKVRLHQGVVPDLLDRATDGIGNFVDFDYRSTGADDPFYTSASGLAYPNRHYPGPMTLVERYTANDGIGGNYTVRFEYKGGVLDMQGRSFQGFSERKVYDSRDNRVLREVLSTTFPQSGRLLQDELTAAGHQVYIRTAALSAKTYGSGSTARYFPYTASETLDHYGDSGNVIKRTTTTNTVDVWGTTTEQSMRIEEISGGLNPGATHELRTVHPTVTNNQTNWCFNKPTQTQQINSHTLPGGAQVTRTTNLSWNTTLCRLNSTVEEPGDPKWQVTTAYTYDSYGNLDAVTVTPASGQGQLARVTDVNWDATGRFPLTITNPLSHVTTFEWDLERGLRTKVTTPNLLTQEFSYDAFDRLTRIENLDGTATDFVLSSCTTFACQGSDTNIRMLLQEISKNTGDTEITQRRRYLDWYGREILTQAKLFDGTYTNSRRVFDARGLVQQTSRPFTAAANAVYETVTYDYLQRPTLIRRPTSDGDSTNHDVSFAYDDFALTQTDALMRTTTSYVDATGRVIRMIDAANSTTEYEYDAFGNLVTTRDPLGVLSTATYNARGMQMSMNDPDMGPWTFDYFPLGELKSQTDAKNQTTTFTYDKLSRPLARTMPESAGSITSTFTWGNSSAAKNIGALQSSQISGTGITTYGETHVYDPKGRLSQTTYSEAGNSYLVDYTYNTDTGFLETITYPTSTSNFRMPILYEYQYGRPLRVTSGGTKWWAANLTDANGNITDATLGDAASGMTLKALSTYDSITNQLVSRSATWDSGAMAGTVVSNQGYLYDRVGNVIQRQNNQAGLTENFYYDSLDRLDYSTRGAQTTDYTYDVRGNITAKTGVGTTYSYTATVAGCTYYPHAQIHAVRQITGATATMNFCYDANGNMTNRNGTSLTWFANNLPKAITKDASNSSTFEYTPAGQRWRHAYKTGGSTYTHTYIGNLVEKVVGPTTTDWKHYVFVNGEAIGLYIRSANGAKSTYYFVKDNIGSMASIARNNGTWSMGESFDAFGQRRSPVSWSAPPTAADLTHMNDTTRRGFTSHEHLDSTGLIHMNGRVYDPLIARFVSADPFVQAPYSSQSLNRYTYAFNNPQRYTDPSGFWGLDDDRPGARWYMYWEFVDLMLAGVAGIEGGPRQFGRPDLWTLRRSWVPRSTPPTATPPHRRRRHRQRYRQNHRRRSQRRRHHRRPPHRRRHRHRGPIRRQRRSAMWSRRARSQRPEQAAGRLTLRAQSM
jgi:RHS repeat-associated protein